MDETSQPASPDTPPADAAAPASATGPEAAEGVSAAKPVRGRGRAVAVVLVVVAVAAAVAAAGYAVLDARLEARADLEEALDLVRGADIAVLAVDDVVRGEITPKLAGAAEEASAQVGPASADLEEALALLERAGPDLSEDDRRVADTLKDAANARLAMLAEAPTLLEANVKAAKALDPAADGVAAMLEAEDLADQAVEKFNLRTKEGVTASTELTNQALEKLAEAGALFDEAQTAFPEADLAAFSEYVDAKAELLGRSKKIDETWLAGDLEAANDLVEEYNEDDVAVSELGEALPESETEPIAAAYDTMANEAAERYFEARGEAASADTALRDLLGTDGET